MGMVSVLEPALPVPNCIHQALSEAACTQQQRHEMYIMQSILIL